MKNGEKWYFEPKNKPGKALDHDTLNKKLVLGSYHGGSNQLWDLEGVEVSSEHMNLPRFYTQEEYDQFKIELRGDIFRRFWDHSPAHGFFRSGAPKTDL